MHKFLLDDLGFADDEVLRIKDGNDDALVDALKSARSTFEGEEGVGQFIFFYAGHGFLDAAGRGWIAPSGFDSNEPAKTGVAMSKFSQSIDDFAKDIGAIQQLWLFACCPAGDVLFSGTRGAPSAEVKFALHHAGLPGVHGLAAVRGSEQSIEVRDENATK